MQKPSKANNKTRHKSPRRWLRWLVLATGLGLTATLGGVAAVIGAYYYVAPGLPAAETIRDIPLQIPLRIFSRDGYLISEIGERRRILVTYDEVPQHVVDAFVAAEDQRFWVHPGIDYRGILRALFQLISSFSIRLMTSDSQLASASGSTQIFCLFGLRCTASVMSAVLRSS